MGEEVRSLLMGELKVVLGLTVMLGMMVMVVLGTMLELVMMLELGMMLQPVKNLQKSPKKVVMQQQVMMLQLVKSPQKSLQKVMMQLLRMGMPRMPEEMHQQHLLLEGEGLEEEMPKTETE